MSSFRVKKNQAKSLETENPVALNQKTPPKRTLAPCRVADQLSLRHSPLLLHLLEGLGPSAAAAVRDLLDLLPLLFLLHHIRVDAPAPALPLAQVLRREQAQSP